MAKLSDPAQHQMVSDLAERAQACLSDLLRSPAAKLEHWFMRLSVAGAPGIWQPLSSDTPENDRIIKTRIADSEKPVTELAAVFLGQVEWRGKKQLMAYMQFFRSSHEQGLLCLHYLEETSGGIELKKSGGLMIVGMCKNTWLGASLAES